MRQINEAGGHLAENFLTWHRPRQYDSKSDSAIDRGGRHQQTHTATLVVACRYWFEVTDGFWGQFTLTQIPHLQPQDLLPSGWQHLESMKNFVGVLQYLTQWKWHDEPDIIESTSGCTFHLTALPFAIDDFDKPVSLGEQKPGELIFADDKTAFKYLVTIARRDLQYRGFRDERIHCFQYKQEANFLLYQLVRNCQDKHEYEMLRQSWDTVNRPPQSNLQWGAKQQEVLEMVHQGYSHEDEESKSNSSRYLYVDGKPGSGKSAVLLECAVRACKEIQVLIICPTGVLVHAFKSKLPEVEGVERITVDTIHGVLNYKRPGPDSKVAWSPPSALRKFDLICMDEGSQYADQEWKRLFTCIKEQPHLPFLFLVADFQQIQPIKAKDEDPEAEPMIKGFAKKMQTVVLDTVIVTPAFAVSVCVVFHFHSKFM